jgi:streptogramin lyase
MSRALPALATAVVALSQTMVAGAAFTTTLPDPPTGVGSVRTLSLGPKSVATYCDATAADGSVWTLGTGYPLRTGSIGSRLTHVLADGSVHQYAIPEAILYERPQCLAVGTNGYVWFAGGNLIVRFDPATAKQRTFAPPHDDGFLVALTAGTNGSLWFTEFHAAAVGEIDSSGHVHEFPLPAQFSTHGPDTVAVMPNGSVWVNATNPTTPTNWPALEELDPQGALVHTYRIPHGGVLALVAGPGGMPWFAYGEVPWGLGRVVAGGTVQILPWRFFSEPTSMVFGPDGRLWFAANDFADAYGYYDTATRVETIFAEPDPRDALAESVALGPDGTIALVSRSSNLYLVSTGFTPSQVSTIAGSLPSPTEVFASVTTVAIGGAISIGAILFITFPSQLFNLTFQENYGEIREWWRRATRRLARFDRSAGKVRRPAGDWAAFGGVVVLGALAGGLLDPHFGTSIATLYTYVAILLAICTGVAVPALVTELYHRARGEDRSWRPHALVGGLAVAVVCVAVSRLTRFEPGYLYGVICGIAFAAKLNPTQKGHVVAMSTVTTLLVAVLAWLVWVPVNKGASQSGASFVLVMLDDFLAAVFVGGLVGTMIGLLPLRFLPGWDLRQWHRGAWLACFGVAVFAVVEVLLIPHNDNHSNTPLVTTIVLLVVFGGISVGMREWFARRHRRVNPRPRSLKEHIRELLTPVDAALSAEPEIREPADPTRRLESRPSSRP